LLELLTVVGDGAVFYLNGVEILRYNMPAAPAAIGYFANAVTAVAGAICTNAAVFVTNLATGTNTLAVEVHQASNWYQNVVFGLELTATFVPADPLPPQAIPELNLQRDADSVTLSWNGGGYALQSSLNITGRWTEVQTNMANPYRTGVTNAERKFWRLHRKQF
jgi:hypothetical protein